MKILQRIRPELFILILLIICLIIAVSELQRDMTSGVCLDYRGNVTILRTVQEINECKNLGGEVLEYNPLSCKLIAVYDDNYNRVYTLSYTNDQVVVDNVTEHIQIDPYVYGKRGSREIIISDEKYNISFLWNSARVERRLIVCVSSKQLSTSDKFYIAIKYLGLILALTLFTTMVYWNSKDISRQFDIHRQVSHIM